MKTLRLITLAMAALVMADEPLAIAESNLSTSSRQNPKMSHHTITESLKITKTLHASLPSITTSSKSASSAISIAETSVFYITNSTLTVTAHATTPSPPTTILTTTTFAQAQATFHSSLQGCYDDLDPDDQACGLVLGQIDICFDNFSPWVDPYNASQSEKFRSCSCDQNGTNGNPYTYKYWQGCATCIMMFLHPDTISYAMAQNVTDFCYAPQPGAYLLISQLSAFFSSIDATAVPRVTAPPLAKVTPVVQRLSHLYTTTPPLANLAWGSNAPPSGGVLKGVTPSLTTFTSGSRTVTNLVTWVPTEAGVTYNATAASLSAASEIASAVSASLATYAEEGNGPAGTTMCYGRGPCQKSGGERRVAGLGIALGVAGLGFGVAMVGV